MSLPPGRFERIEIECDGSGCGLSNSRWHVHIGQDLGAKTEARRVRWTNGVFTHVGPATGSLDLSPDLQNEESTGSNRTGG